MIKADREGVLGLVVGSLILLAIAVSFLIEFVLE